VRPYFSKKKTLTFRLLVANRLKDLLIPGIRRWEPAYVPKTFDPSRVDRVMDVSRSQALEMTRHLALQEGLFCGLSSGCGAFAALALAKELSNGFIFFICCDRGDRYMSSDLFDL